LSGAQPSAVAADRSISPNARFGWPYRNDHVRHRPADQEIHRTSRTLKADKSVPESEKREDLAQLEAALKHAKPVQFKENIALVLKYFDQLVPFVQEQDLKLRPAD
jgi:D-mannonate dehydratase